MIQITQNEIVVRLPRVGHGGFFGFNWGVIGVALACLVAAASGSQLLSLETAAGMTVIASANLILHYLFVMGRASEQVEIETENYSRPSRLSTRIACSPFGESRSDDALELVMPHAELIEDDYSQPVRNGGTVEEFKEEIERILSARDLQRLDRATDEELGLLPMPDTAQLQKMNGASVPT